MSYRDGVVRCHMGCSESMSASDLAEHLSEVHGLHVDLADAPVVDRSHLRAVPHNESDTEAESASHFDGYPATTD